MKFKINILLPLCGFTAFLGGILNGLLGTGAGIIFTLLFTILYANDTDKEKRDIFASCLICTAPVCAMSAFIYSSADVGLLRTCAPYLPFALVGGLLGGILLNKVKNGFLGKLFAVLCGISGVIMICKAF